MTTDLQGTEWQPQLHTTISLGRTLRDHSSLMPDNPRMRTFSQTTLTIRMDECTDKPTDRQTDGRTKIAKRLQ